MPEIIPFRDGLHIRFTDGRDFAMVDDKCRVTLPAWFSGDVIPDEFIRADDPQHDESAAEWYRRPVNAWWKEYRASQVASAKGCGE